MSDSWPPDKFTLITSVIFPEVTLTATPIWGGSVFDDIKRLEADGWEVVDAKRPNPDQPSDFCFNPTSVTLRKPPERHVYSPELAEIHKLLGTLMSNCAPWDRPALHYRPSGKEKGKGVKRPNWSEFHSEFYDWWWGLDFTGNPEGWMPPATLIEAICDRLMDLTKPSPPSLIKTMSRAGLLPYAQKVCDGLRAGPSAYLAMEVFRRQVADRVLADKLAEVT